MVVTYEIYTQDGIKYKRGSDGSIWEFDPGGETRYGISKRSYPMLDIANLTKQEAAEIYWHQYWVEAGCDTMTWPLNLIMFDSAVNCGIGQALQFLEESQGNPKQYLTLRRYFYQQLHQFALYGVGWMRRVDQLEELANL